MSTLRKVCLRPSRVVLALLLGVGILASGPAPLPASSESALIFSASGDEALVRFSSNVVDALLYVARGGRPLSRETFLTYAVIDQLTGMTVQEGAGQIPNEAFTVIGNQAQLSIDSSTLPDFGFYAGSGGPLNVVWSKNGAFVLENAGSSETRARDQFKLITGSVRVLESAEVQGTIFGYSVGGVGESTLGSTQGTTVLVQR